MSAPIEEPIPELPTEQEINEITERLRQDLASRTTARSANNGMAVVSSSSANARRSTRANGSSSRGTGIPDSPDLPEALAVEDVIEPPPTRRLAVGSPPGSNKATRETRKSLAASAPKLEEAPARVSPKEAVPVASVIATPIAVTAAQIAAAPSAVMDTAASQKFIEQIRSIAPKESASTRTSARPSARAASPTARRSAPLDGRLSPRRSAPLDGGLSPRRTLIPAEPVEERMPSPRRLTSPRRPSRPAEEVPAPSARISPRRTLADVVGQDLERPVRQSSPSQLRRLSVGEAERSTSSSRRLPSQRMPSEQDIVEELPAELAASLEQALVQAKKQGPLSRRFNLDKPYGQYLAEMEEQFAGEFEKKGGNRFQEQVDTITTRFGIEPTSSDKFGVIWKDSLGGLPVVMVSNRQDMHVLPHPHYDVVNIAYPLTVPPKMVEKLHHITTCATYVPDKEQLWISTDSWADAMIIAATLRAYVEGHTQIHDARDSIEMLKKKIRKIPSLLDAQENYVFA